MHFAEHQFRPRLKSSTKNFLSIFFSFCKEIWRARVPFYNNEFKELSVLLEIIHTKEFYGCFGDFEKCMNSLINPLNLPLSLFYKRTQLFFLLDLPYCRSKVCHDGRQGDPGKSPPEVLHRSRWHFPRHATGGTTHSEAAHEQHPSETPPAKIKELIPGGPKKRNSRFCRTLLLSKVIFFHLAG